MWRQRLASTLQTQCAGWNLGNKNQLARAGKTAAGSPCVDKTQSLGQQSWASVQHSSENQWGRNEVGQHDSALKELGGENKLE
jgi:hypothetical protein